MICPPTTEGVAQRAAGDSAGRIHERSDHTSPRPVVIVIQGEEDRAVSVSENRRVAREMERLGMRYRYLEIAGAGHDLSEVPVAEEVFGFFLGGGASTP